MDRDGCSDVTLGTTVQPATGSGSNQPLCLMNNERSVEQLMAGPRRVHPGANWSEKRSFEPVAMPPSRPSMPRSNARCRRTR